MSAERDELMRLVRGIPEDQVPQALMEVRRQIRAAHQHTWPPGFFASAPSDGVGIAEQADEILRRGFGR